MIKLTNGFRVLEGRLAVENPKPLFYSNCLVV